MSDEMEAGLVMPFVSTTDTGGPHDPQSYVCGFEMGVLDTVLGMCSHLRQRPGIQLIHGENAAQADLIAMKHGYKMDRADLDGYEEWASVGFDWAETDFDENEDEQ